MQRLLSRIEDAWYAFRGPPEVRLPLDDVEQSPNFGNAVSEKAFTG
jgi:hypothetical protein